MAKITLYEPQVDMTGKSSNVEMPSNLPALWTRGAAVAARASGRPRR